MKARHSLSRAGLNKGFLKTRKLCSNLRICRRWLVNSPSREPWVLRYFEYPLSGRHICREEFSAISSSGVLFNRLGPSEMLEQNIL